MVSLDHFIWRSLPKIGYPDDPVAKSSGVNPKMFTNFLMNEPIPIEYRSIYTSPDFRGYIIFNNSDIPQILFTTVSWIEKGDEHGRPSLFHHSVIINKELLKMGKISFFEIDKMMIYFQKTNTNAQGIIDPLEVKEKVNPNYDYPTKIELQITQSAVESLVNRLIINNNNKAIIRCGSIEQSLKFEIAVYLFELLNLECDLKSVAITTEPPRPEYIDIFNIVVTETLFEIPRDEKYWLPAIDPYEHIKNGKIKIPKNIQEKIDNAYS